jgi:hypothetical protein
MLWVIAKHQLAAVTEETSGWQQLCSIRYCQDITTLPTARHMHHT